MNAANSDLEQKPCEGLKRYPILACYLSVVFASRISHRSVILSGHGIQCAADGLVLVNVNF